MSAPTPSLCEGCQELKPVAYTDAVGREYCPDCLPLPSVYRMLAFLMHTIPFHVGDTVECRTAGVLYDGVGVVDDISIEPHHYGTPVYPSFHVKLTDKAYPEAPDALWYCESQLKRVKELSS